MNIIFYLNLFNIAFIYSYFLILHVLCFMFIARSDYMLHFFPILCFFGCLLCSVCLPITFFLNLFLFLFFFFIITLSFFFFLIYFLAVLGLRFVRGLSPVAASGGHSSSRCGDRSSSRCAGLSPSRPLQLRGTGSRRAGSAIVAHGPSRSVACGILPDQGSNPCPLH